MQTQVTMGPLLFHWPAEDKRDFYFRIADEAPVGTVYLGEVICSKREPFFSKYHDQVAERLQKAGKTVVFASFAEVMTPRERKLTQALCEDQAYPVEANDASALYFLRGKQHRVGQYFNVYNEETLSRLAGNGAVHFSLSAELPKDVLSVLSDAAREQDVSLEVQVFGRMGLALSARCYHARACDRVKDNCRYACEADPDGMELKTLDGMPFLSINGIQTLSHTGVNLVQEIPEMMDMGISHFRLSPHTCDMVEVAKIFDDVIHGRKSPQDAVETFSEKDYGFPFSNGFYHKDRGYEWKQVA